ncbi:MAG: rhodanese-like domain-containing protein [Sulfuricurvum sp.]|uniref:rhodanese-like domain-containing protein n=1 Tax=Sulfuricurvum sp. TaxID=2025608 RepID=UPI0025D86467|nr:rhodanese-like domain-containing protein [Sulfuricurvum sp.]MCK9373718.1 rhodanese-like domain-containing protein [Sulfuricurvum sp.]
MKPITTVLYALVIITIAAYAAYFKGWIFANFDSITPKEAYTRLHNDPNLFLLDVRTPEEFAQEHIEGATLIPVQVLSENLSKLEPLKDKTIIVYCRSGNRSVSASRILSNNGFTPLNVTGGINGWKSEGLGVTR